MQNAMIISREDERLCQGMSHYTYLPVGNFSAFRDDLHKSLPTRIAEFIADGVFQGHYKPGDRLKEEELSKTFQTSRAPIREALYLLQINGLVERLPRRGCIIRSYNKQEIEDLYEVRLGLEAIAVDRLSNHWKPTFNDAFKGILSDMEQAINVPDALAYAHLNNDFHDLLYKLSGNEVLYKLYQQLGHPIVPLLQASMQQVDSLHKSYMEHKDIIEALCSEDFMRAKELLLQNMQHGMQRAIALISI